MAELILLNKPFRCLSQFSDTDGRTTLADVLHDCNQRDISGFYPAGRLDYDSEGLLLLTDDGALQHQISHPSRKMPKTYWAQVEGEANESAMRTLRSGVRLKDGKSSTASIRVIETPDLWPRNPPVRQRLSVTTHWLEIIIREGRNRQVRRMTAAVGLPTLRLVRVAIGPWSIDNLQPGEYRFEKIHLPKSPQRNR